MAAEVAEVQGRVVAVAAAALPECLGDAPSLGRGAGGWAGGGWRGSLVGAGAAGCGAMALAFDRVSRAVRQTAALVARLDAGWPRRGGSDDRVAMARRQVGRSVGEAIGRQADGEAAERLFDDLSERLDEAELAVGWTSRRRWRSRRFAGTLG